MSDFETITSLPPLPTRPADGHKGTFGTVIVVGGCKTMMGAPALCAAAALRAGAGLVKVAVPGPVLPVVLAIEPGATGVILSDNPSDSLCSLDEADPRAGAVLAVGPGMGQSPAAGELVSLLLAGSRPMVLDADGLNLLAASGAARSTPTPDLVLTPHPGEFARLAKPLGITPSPTDAGTRADAATQLAKAHSAVVVLKGRRTVVADGRRLYTNTTGNPALATGGSGDVLTGVIAALIAQGMAAFEAAVLGVHTHGLAADLWAKQHGPSGMTALDLARLLPDALNRLR